MQVKIKKLSPDAITPTYATDGSACFDLYVIGCGNQHPVYSGISHKFRTGISLEIPDGHVMLLFSRSGHGIKNSTRLSNCVGVIDSDYRGEIVVSMARDGQGNEVLRVNPGDRIAQAMILPVQRVEFIEADELSDTARGDGGFGSTGK